jgi:tetratricopeptide (TPR) repeat protein
MLKNKWFYSAVFVIIFPIFLFINIQNNTSFNSENQTNLDNVSNEEMEEVIALNPNVMGMRIALANRYFEEFEYSKALIHYMYVAQNSNEVENKSYSLAQIGWMVYESGDEQTALNYLNQSLLLTPESLLSQTYIGIIKIQNQDTRSEGVEILNYLLKNFEITDEDKDIIVEILSVYEN